MTNNVTQPNNHDIICMDKLMSFIFHAAICYKSVCVVLFLSLKRVRTTADLCLRFCSFNGIYRFKYHRAISGSFHICRFMSFGFGKTLNFNSNKFTLTRMSIFMPGAIYSTVKSNWVTFGADVSTAAETLKHSSSFDEVAKLKNSCTVNQKPKNE